MGDNHTSRPGSVLPCRGFEATTEACRTAYRLRREPGSSHQHPHLPVVSVHTRCIAARYHVSWPHSKAWVTHPFRPCLCPDRLGCRTHALSERIKASTCVASTLSTANLLECLARLRSTDLR